MQPATNGVPVPDDLVVYGTGWCPDVRRSRALLDGMGVPYRYVDLEQDAQASRYVRQLQQGRRRIPTVVASDGRHVVEPGDAELLEFLTAPGSVPVGSDADSR